MDYRRVVTNTIEIVHRFVCKIGKISPRILIDVTITTPYSQQMISFHPGLSAFTNNYDAFIVDLWGVIHDGVATYPRVKETLQHLQNEGKTVVFLSNAPRRSHKVINALTSLGIDRLLYHDVISSGEAFFDYAASHPLGSQYLYIGPERDAGELDGLSYIRTEDASIASFALVTGFDQDSSTIEEKQPQLQAAITYHLPLYCINPDKIIVRISGEKALCAGVIAETYTAMGGVSHYFGKPYPAVYESCMRLLSTFDKKRIAAIGDSLDTDIKGANSVGIDSVLITGGILKAMVGEDKAKLEKFCATHDISPKMALPAFVW